jgi:hypothetical protein
MTVYSVTAGLQPPALSVASSPVGALRTMVLSAVAGTLNTSVADVQGRLRAGQSLTELARTAGLSRDELVASINAAVQASGRVAPDLAVDEVVQRIADQRKRSDRASPAHDRATPRATPRTTGESAGALGRLLDVEL